jgi:hypothetical protein
MLEKIDYRSFIITTDTHYETETNYDFYTKIFIPKLEGERDLISPIAYTKLATYWTNRMNKKELLGLQSDSDFKLNIENEFVYITGSCIISSEGNMFLP